MGRRYQNRRIPGGDYCATRAVRATTRCGLWLAAIVLHSAAIHAADELLLTGRSDHLGTLAREPMLAVHPSGTLFVAAYPSQVTGRDWTAPPLLWRSEDAGVAWERVDVGSMGDGAQGNSDVDLAVAADGRLYFVSMGFNRDTAQGTHIALGTSANRGKDWSWEFLSQTPLDDRPWVAVDARGRAHAIWNDGAGVVYRRQPIAGAAWTPPQRLSERGGSSHLAVGGEDRIAVRVSPISASANRFDSDADYLLVSSDGGESWERRQPPATLVWDPTLSDPGGIPRWVEPLAWTGDGVLHHVWSEGASMRYGYSRDLGDTWIIHDLATHSGKAFFPYLVASDAGELAATWFVAEGGDLTVHLAKIERTVDGQLQRVLRAAPFRADAWDETRERRALTPAGEYVPAAFLPDGAIAVVTPIQDIKADRWGFSFWRFAAQPAER